MWNHSRTEKSDVKRLKTENRHSLVMTPSGVAALKLHLHLSPPSHKNIDGASSTVFPSLWHPLVVVSKVAQRVAAKH